jgi:hypothetical protein
MGSGFAPYRTNKGRAARCGINGNKVKSARISKRTLFRPHVAISADRKVYGLALLLLSLAEGSV